MKKKRTKIIETFGPRLGSFLIDLKDFRQDAIKELGEVLKLLKDFQDGEDKNEKTIKDVKKGRITGSKKNVKGKRASKVLKKSKTKSKKSDGRMERRKPSLGIKKGTSCKKPKAGNSDSIVRGKKGRI